MILLQEFAHKIWYKIGVENMDDGHHSWLIFEKSDMSIRDSFPDK